MTPHQRIAAVICGISLFILIVELVRRRKLKEEFSLLWMITGIGVVVLAVWHQLVQWLANLIGAALPMSALFFFGVLFLILINIHYAVKVSYLSDRLKNLSQEVTLLQDGLAESAIDRDGGSGGGGA